MQNLKKSDRWGRWAILSLCTRSGVVKKVDIDIYQILDLEMFYRLFGWCSILEDGNYAPPGQLWDDE